jgi:hypothetical protein
VQARKSQVASTWEGVQPVLSELQAACARMPSMATVRFNLTDWQWASSTFMARVVSLPVSDKEPDTTIESLVPGARLLCAAPSLVLNQRVLSGVWQALIAGLITPPCIYVYTCLCYAGGGCVILSSCCVGLCAAGLVLPGFGCASVLLGLASLDAWRWLRARSRGSAWAARAGACAGLFILCPSRYICI